MAAEEGRLSDTFSAARHLVKRAPCLHVLKADHIYYLSGISEGLADSTRKCHPNMT